MTSSDATPGLLHHVELYVSHLERSRRFWQFLLENLGYSVFQEWASGFSFKLGPTYVVFVQTEEAHQLPPYHRKQTGLNHFAFHARSRAHVDELTTALQERGVPILYADRHPFAGGDAHYAVYFEDPDRIKVEVVAPDAS